MTRTIKIGKYSLGAGHPLNFILGPCVVESEKITLTIAERLRGLADRLKIPVIFKASYQKANRTSIKSFAGLDFDEALAILAKVKEQFGLPVLTDIHTTQEIPAVADVADCLQIPAFLCRQTQLIAQAAKTDLPLNIKKGPFLTPTDMRHAAEKAKAGAGGVMFTERGTTFGYGDLVVDFRGLVIMRQLGYPVCYDASHSVQKPGAAGGSSGGAREFILPLARAAAGVGIDALFCEVHPDPPSALSDAATQWPLDRVEELMENVLAVQRAATQLGKTT
jgi:2-dehydro-3-deoxyphosphooctonate aldolase (KDO 8-P synthase)